MGKIANFRNLHEANNSDIPTQSSYSSINAVQSLREGVFLIHVLS